MNLATHFAGELQDFSRPGMAAGKIQIRELPANLVHVVFQDLTAIAQQSIYPRRDFCRTDLLSFVRGGPNRFHNRHMGIEGTTRQQVLLVGLQQWRQGFPDFRIPGDTSRQASALLRILQKLAGKKSHRIGTPQ